MVATMSPPDKVEGLFIVEDCRHDVGAPFRHAGGFLTWPQSPIGLTQAR